MRLSHKALRYALNQAVAYCGVIDDEQADAALQISWSIESALEFVTELISAESSSYHSAIEARRPYISRRPHIEHFEIEHVIGDIIQDLRFLRELWSMGRASSSQVVYGKLQSLHELVLRHLKSEADEANEYLWSLYSDDELAELERDCLEKLPLAQLEPLARWMARSVRPDELIRVVEHIRAFAAPVELACILAVLRPRVSDVIWDQICSELDVQGETVRLPLGHIEQMATHKVG